MDKRKIYQDYSIAGSSGFSLKGNDIFFYPVLFIVLFLIQFISMPEAFSLDQPFNNSTNWGGTGLMEIPNARVLEDGVVRIGFAQALPYRWYTAGMGILPGLEFTGRMTEITNIPALTPEYGSNKDKAFDLKYQLIPESKNLPALAIGINDFHGTRLFPSEYLVLSRQYYPLDITLGVGSKRLKGPLTLPFIDKFGLFGGVEVAVNERVNFMAEYNPIEYEKDTSSARGIPDGARYPVNIGIRAKILSGVNLGLSYQRGNTLGLMLHVQSELGKPVLPYKSDPAPLVSIDRRPFKERDQKEMIEEIHKAIKDAGFSDVSVYTDGIDLIAEFENQKYLSNQKAVGRVLRILLFYSPMDTKELIAVVRKRGMAILKVSVNPDQMERYLLGEISEDVFNDKLIKVQVTKDAIEDEQKGYIKTEEDTKNKFKFGIKPDLEIYWNDPSGFFKYAVGVAPYLTADLWKGASVYVRYNIPLYSNVYSPSVAALPNDVVKSDVSRYMGKYYSFDRLLINQVVRLDKKLFGRVSLGYFDKMYAGVGGETLFFPGEGKMALGIEGDWVMKREPEKMFELMDVKRNSILANAYYYYPGLDMTFHAKYGKFLAGDVGWMFEISRQYDTGAVVGMYFSLTDTDKIEPASFNKGYNNKGVYLTMPLRMLLNHDSAQTLNYGVSPWTRDVAITVPHWQDLFDLGKELMPAKFNSKLHEIKE